MHQDKGQSLTCADVDDPVTLPAPLHEAAAHECHRCLRQAAPCCYVQHLQVAHCSQAAGKASSLTTYFASQRFHLYRLLSFCLHLSSLLTITGAMKFVVARPIRPLVVLAVSQGRHQGRHQGSPQEQEEDRCDHAGSTQMRVPACWPGAGDAPLC